MAHDDPGVRGILTINRVLGPQIKHDQDTVKDEAQKLGEGHERITSNGGVGFPDREVAQVNNCHRHIDTTYISGLNNMWHEGERNDVGHNTCKCA